VRSIIEVQIDGANQTCYVTENGKPVARFNDHMKAGDYAVMLMRERAEKND
jgi:hypothetical protein